MAVDFDAVRATAQADGINLGEVAIVYKGLTAEQVRTLTERGLVAAHLEWPGSLLGKFTPEGEALFPEQADSVSWLAG